MERWVGRVALVTGASAGIGAVVAERLVKHGMIVVGCARRVDRIQALSDRLKGQKGCLEAVKCDLTKEEEILAMFENIKKSHGGVDVCINNAGLAHVASLLYGDTAAWKNMFDVNVLAVCICTREAFKSMKERGVDDGQIVHISSMSGHRMVGNDSTVYTATKFALRAITEGHRAELHQAKSHIRVSAISPGLVETEFIEQQKGDEYAKKLYAKMKCLQSDDIADAVEYIVSAPPHVQVHDILMRPTEQVS